MQVEVNYLSALGAAVASISGYSLILSGTRDDIVQGVLPFSMFYAIF